jgi:hypothetical protein
MNFFIFNDKLSTKNKNSLFEDFSQNIHKCQYRMNSSEFEQIINANSYEIIEKSMDFVVYYSKSNTHDLPNIIYVMQGSNDKNIYIVGRAWTKSKPKKMRFHFIGNVIEAFLPYLHRYEKPAYIHNPLDFFSKTEPVSVIFAQNGKFHSNYYPAFYSGKKMQFYLFGKNKTSEFKEFLKQEQNKEQLTFFDNKIGIEHDDYIKLTSNTENQINQKWISYCQEDDFNVIIDEFKDTKNIRLNNTILDTFYKMYKNKEFVFYSLTSEDSLYDLPDLIIKGIHSDFCQKVWKNAKDEPHRNPEEPAVITYQDGELTEDYYLDGININQFSPSRKEYSQIKDLFNP